MNIVITAGNGGLGQAFVNQLARTPGNHITATYCHNKPKHKQANVNWQRLDLSDETQIADWSADLGDIDWFINAAGMLHTPANSPEKSLSQFDTEFFMQNIQLNTLPTLLLAKHLQKHFRHERPALFASLSARIGSIEDNHLGGWYSYRISKAGLNMALKTLSIEWQRKYPNVTVAAIHPGTNDTALTKPFHKHIPAKQLMPPEQGVTNILNVLYKLGQQDSGRFWAFDGEELPW